MAHQTQQNIVPWCLFDSSIKKANCIDVTLGYSLLEITSEKFSKKETLLDY